MERLMVFSLVFCVAYVAAYYFGLSLFAYYPVEHTLRLIGAAQSGDQVVLWYGWLASAGLVGALAALLVPRRWAALIPPDLLWLTGVVLVIAVLAYEKRWFV